MFSLVDRRGSSTVVGVFFILVGWVALVQPLVAQDVSRWSDSLYAVIRTDLENLTSEYKGHFSVTQDHALSLALVGFEESDGVALQLRANRGGFSAVATHELFGLYFGCTVYFGAIDPPVYPIQPSAEGEIACTTGRFPSPLADPEPDPSAEPTFTPHDVAPALNNPRDVGRALAREYPPLLRDAGIVGTVHLWLFIDEEGMVQRALVLNSSGHKGLDDAAMEVIKTAEFTPALRQDQPVPVWMIWPVTFRVRLPAFPAESSPAPVPGNTLLSPASSF